MPRAGREERQRDGVAVCAGRTRRPVVSVDLNPRLIEPTPVRNLSHPAPCRDSAVVPQQGGAGIEMVHI